MTSEPTKYGGKVHFQGHKVRKLIDWTGRPTANFETKEEEIKNLVAAWAAKNICSLSFSLSFRPVLVQVGKSDANGG